MKLLLLPKELLGKKHIMNSEFVQVLPKGEQRCIYFREKASYLSEVNSKEVIFI